MRVFKFAQIVVGKCLMGTANVSSAFVLAIVVITCYEVISRYVFNSPTIWTVDIGIYLLLWLAFLSMGYLQKQGKHIHVDLVISHLSEGTRAILDVASSVLFLIGAALISYYSIGLVSTAIRMGETSIGLLFHPIWPVKISIPIGASLLTLWLLLELIQKVSALSQNQPYKKPGWVRQSVTPVVIFVALVVFSCFLLKVSPAAGMVCLMCTLLFSGLPVFPSLLLVGVSGVFIYFGGFDGRIIGFPQILYGSLNDFSLVCLPMFVLCGTIIATAGVGRELYEFCSTWFSRLRGAEGIATVAACTIFAAISASSVATVATIGVIAIPALLARKYNPSLSYGLLAAGGTLGIMIPPSASMIIYSMVTEESLGKCFMAGIFPGLILAVGFALWIIFYRIRKGGYEPAEKVSWHRRFDSLRTALWGLSVPAIIMGGILSGVFTPLESGAVAVLYSFIMVLVRRKLKVRDLFAVVTESLHTIVMIFAIIVGALVLGYFVTLMQLPSKLVDFVISHQIQPWVAMGMIMGVLIFMGMFLEVISIMMITMPIFYPLIISLGFDGIWFAVMVTLNMEMALITPPVGLNCYVVQGIAKVPLWEVARGIVPFFFIMLLGLVLFAAVPQLSTWLPNMVVGAW